MVIEAGKVLIKLKRQVQEQLEALREASSGAGGNATNPLESAHRLLQEVKDMQRAEKAEYRRNKLQRSRTIFRGSWISLYKR